MYDGTTKKIGHVVESQVSTENQTYLLGLRAQVNGTTATYYETLKTRSERSRKLLSPTLAKLVYFVISQIL